MRITEKVFSKPGLPYPGIIHGIITLEYTNSSGKKIHITPGKAGKQIQIKVFRTDLEAETMHWERKLLEENKAVQFATQKEKQ